MTNPVGTVRELWRYPVKSMVGESVASATLTAQGLTGDRQWAVRDESRGELTVVRKNPRLLQCAARFAQTPEGNDIPAVIITLPDGRELSSDDPDCTTALSEHLRKPVTLWSLQPASNWRHYRLAEVGGARDLKRQFGTRTLPDLSSVPMMLAAQLSFFATPPGRYHDVFPLHLLSTNALAAMAGIEPAGDFVVQRFRPNIVIASANSAAEFDDFSWVDGYLHVGDCVIKCATRTVRCSAPAQPQYGGIAKDGKVVRALDRHTNRHLGINATVASPGTLRVGDEVRWEPARSLLPRSLLRLAAHAKSTMLHATLTGLDIVTGKR